MSSDKVAFNGIVVHLDTGGFGLVRFNSAVNDASFGFFTEHTRNYGSFGRSLRVGEHVKGYVEVLPESVLPVEAFKVD